MEVILSSGDEIRKIKQFELEIQDLPLGHEDMIVLGQPNKEQLFSLTHAVTLPGLTGASSVLLVKGRLVVRQGGC